MPTKLDLFLNGNPDGKTEKERQGRKVTESGKPFTLWSFENREKWFLDSDDMEEFYKLYCEDLRRCVPRFLTEKSTPIGQMRVDLDFKYDGKVADHKHTLGQVIAFAKAYMEETKRFLEVPETVEMYVLEKGYPTFDPSKKISSSGIHIQVPGLKSRADVEQSIRRSLLRRMDEFFPDLGCNKGWDDVYDKQPLTHTNNWPLLGSKKPAEGAMPYEIRYVLDWDSETGEISVDQDVNPMVTIDLVKKLSVRSRLEEETPLTTHGKENTRPPAEPREVLRSVSRGRIPESRSSSPGRNYIAPLTESYKEYLNCHVKNLKDERFTQYAEWISVGQCLKNIHPDLEEVWLEFSEQVNVIKPGSYNQREAMNKWQSFGFRVEGERLSVGSLRHWSRTDNYDRFQEIESTNVDRLVKEAALTCTEGDVAQVIFAKYRDEFKCSAFKNNEWYHYVGHIWRSTDNGVELLKRLSTDIAKLFLEKEREEMTLLETIDTCSHKEMDPTCDCCTAEKRKKQYSAVRLRLKTISFKENVLKECRLLFFDKEFAMKLDENKNLIAFTNCIYDTLTRAPREGRAEDCISKCVNIEYNPTIQHHQFACWPELRKFLDSILPNRSVREYCMKHLSRCLSGNYTQDFHILTGEGSNGKSMLMNLMMTCFGDYAYKVNIALFTQKRGKAGAAAPELVRMKGVRFVMMSEPDQDDTISEGFMKEVTGSEKIPCRDLYGGSKQIIEMDVQAKFHMACNKKPKVNDTSNGAWRRLKVVDFPNKFVHDPVAANELPIDETIMSKTQSVEWAECFMSYLIHLYEEGMGHAKLKAPKEVDAFTQEYKVESDTIARFVQEYIHDPEQQPGDPEVEVPDQVSWSTITMTFQEWKRSNDLRSGNTDELKKRLEGKYGKMPRNGWSAFRFGVGE